MSTMIPITLGAGDDPLAHVVNHPAFTTESGWVIWSSIQGTMVLAGLLLIGGGLFLASRIRTGPASMGSDAYVPRSRLANLFEVMCVYLREEVARPLLHDRTDKLMPFLWTIFFFILVNNLLGLVPIVDLFHAAEGVTNEHIPMVLGGTPTQSIWVTGVLAVIAAIVFNLAAVIRLGPVGFVKHMMGGLPIYMLPIALLLLVIEAAGQFLIKPFALALRLFANMTAGHVLIAALLLIAGKAVKGVLAGDSLILNGGVTIVGVLAIMAVTFLEIFVAFLQAFVFMFLTTIFISLMDHHDEHGHEHEHGHAEGHEHAHA